MNCPVCPNAQLLLAERQGIEIDYCPTCRGVWLDRGELDKVIERSEAALSAGPSAYTADDRHYDDNERGGDFGGSRRGRHGSLLGDLFDFGG